MPDLAVVERPPKKEAQLLVMMVLLCKTTHVLHSPRHQFTVVGSASHSQSFSKLPQKEGCGDQKALLKNRQITTTGKMTLDICIYKYKKALLNKIRKAQTSNYTKHKYHDYSVYKKYASYRDKVPLAGLCYNSYSFY